MEAGLEFANIEPKNNIYIYVILPGNLPQSIFQAAR